MDAGSTVSLFPSLPNRLRLTVMKHGGVDYMVKEAKALLEELA